MESRCGILGPPPPLKPSLLPHRLGAECLEPRMDEVVKNHLQYYQYRSTRTPNWLQVTENIFTTRAVAAAEGMFAGAAVTAAC